MGSIILSKYLICPDCGRLFNCKYTRDGINPDPELFYCRDFSYHHLCSCGTNSEVPLQCEIKVIEDKTDITAHKIINPSVIDLDINEV